MTGETPLWEKLAPPPPPPLEKILATPLIVLQIHLFNTRISLF